MSAFATCRKVGGWTPVVTLQILLDFDGGAAYAIELYLFNVNLKQCNYNYKDWEFI